MAKLRTKMPPNHVLKHDQKLQEFYNMSKMTAMKSCRSATKNALPEFKNSISNDLLRSEPHTQALDLVSEVEDLLTTARLITIKWGILTLVFPPDIRSLVPAGDVLRKDLKAAWELNQNTDGVKDFLGETRVAEILDILKTKSVQPKTTPPGAAPTASGSDVVKIAGKSAGATSAKRSKKGDLETGADVPKAKKRRGITSGD